ncbi:hypothetical protein D3C85_1645900 [compost metagenome]
MKHIELALAPGSARFDVHAFEQVRVALGIEDDDHLVLTAVDILGDIHLGQAGLADPRGAQHQGVPDALAERQARLCFVGLDPVQQRRTSYRG